MISYNQIRRILMAKQKGSYCSMVWERELPLKKQYSGNNIVVKRSTGLVRCGVAYENIKAVKERNLPNNGLAWGTWKLFPFFIEHNNNIYLRCTEAIGNNVKTEYYLNGRRVEKSDVQGLCLKSAFTPHSSMDVFNIKLENILSFK